MAAIYLIRHGQADFGADDYDRLTDRGVAQSRRLGAALRAAGLADSAPRLVCGSLLRHRDTARHCLTAMGLNRVPEEQPAWNEFDHLAVLRAAWPAYGDPGALREALRHEESPRAAFQQLFDQAVARWTGGEHDADYAEPWPAFQARCRAALAALAEGPDRRRDVLVFTSGGPIAAVVQEQLRLATAQAIGLNWMLVNTGITKLIIGRTGPRLSTLNGHAHLEQAGPEWITYR